MHLLNAYYLQVVTFVVINAILALSFYLPLSAGQLSLGSAGFMSIGAYTAAVASLHYGWTPYLTIPAGAVAAAVVGLVLGFPALRLTGIYLAIATLGFGEVVRVVFLNLRITNGALGLAGIPNLNTYFGNLYQRLGAGGSILAPAFSTLLLTCLLLAIAVYFVAKQEKSRIGRAMAAVKADEVASGAMGIGTTYIKMLAFVEGAFLAGLAGAVSAHVTNYISPGDFDYQQAINILLFVVLGGSEIVWGGVLGSFILTLLPEMLRFLQDFRWIIFGALLVVTMVFRPQGLIDRQVWERLFSRGGRSIGGGTGESSREVGG